MDYEVVAPGQNDALLQNRCEPGCWEPIKNIHDPYVQEMGRFAVMEHTHKLVGASLKFICVVSGETRPMSQGKEYRLVVEVAEQIITSPPMLSVSIKFYLATVLEKPIDRSWQLISFVSSN
ncbi:cysteine proteinase inhibitor 5-like [Benincasa hispida]|uniref:cysteine proteinase inhibitor 5-like n=1 Tax=Benincasa hispida TaxID=102211 RepID=UPI0019004452|nr:cysteine proteinase inhibitor 5-like [Benincasa hispida]